MSIKILDADCAINLLERMRSYNCVPFLSSYDTIMTDEVLDELEKGNSFRGCVFKTYSLSDKEAALYNEMSRYISRLGKGERSAMVHALFLSNGRTCEDADKIVVLCNDKEANHIFHNVVCKDPKIKRMFPNIQKIIWSGTAEVIRKLWNEGYIDKKTANNIHDELHMIMGPKLDFLIH